MHWIYVMYVYKYNNAIVRHTVNMEDRQQSIFWYSWLIDILAFVSFFFSNILLLIRTGLTFSKTFWILKVTLRLKKCMAIYSYVCKVANRSLYTTCWKRHRMLTKWQSYIARNWCTKYRLLVLFLTFLRWSSRNNRIGR